MSGKRKKEIEFRYYEIPEGEQVLALLGDSWKRVYGDEGNFLHFHNLMEIGFCLEGTGNMTFDEEEISYSPGALTVIPSNYPHVTNSWMKSINYWEYIFFDPEKILKSVYPKNKVFVDRVLEKLNRTAKFFEDGKNEELKSLVRMIMEECRNRRSYSNEVLKGLILSVIMLIARDDSYNGTETEVIAAPVQKNGLEQIIEAINYMNEQYMNEIRVEELASRCSLSETHFRRIFGECMNMTPAEYLTLVRIKKSCELIRRSRYSMEEVAVRVGYPTVSTFNRNFRKIVGTSPYQYKKNRDNYEGKLLNFKVSAKKGW